MCKQIRSAILPRLKSTEGKKTSLRLVAQMRVGSRRNQTWSIDFTYIVAARLELHISTTAGLRSFRDGLLKAKAKGWKGPTLIDISLSWQNGSSHFERVSGTVMALVGSLLFETLKHCDGLHRLKLENCALSNLCATQIANSLPCCKELSHFSLRFNCIGDDGAKALSRSLPQCSSLAHLDLSDNVIGDPGGKALASAVPLCRALANLLFGGNGIGRGVCLKLQDALRTHKSATADDEEHGGGGRSAADGHGEDNGGG